MTLLCALSAPSAVSAAPAHPHEEGEHGLEAARRPPSPAALERARALLREVPLIDGHNDLPWQLRKRAQGRLSVLDLEAATTQLDPPMHTDLPRLKQGQVGGQFWSVYVPASLEESAAVQATLEQIDVVKRLARRFPDRFQVVTRADEVEVAFRAGRVASLIGMEGGHSIGRSLAVLRQLYALGARYLTLTHSKTHDWADSATDAPRHDGLSAFGEKVVREMNRLGMLVDLSHVSEATMRDSIRVSEAPVIFSHSGAAGVCAHPRNVPDEVLDLLPANGGVVMVIFLPGYLNCDRAEWWATRRGEEARLAARYPHDPDFVAASLRRWEETHPAPRVDLDDVVAHIDHIRARIGADYIGLGGDYDGMGPGPLGLEDVSRYPELLAALLERGYSEDEVKGIAGLNVLRALRGAEATAARLSTQAPDETPPLAAEK